MLNTNIDLGQVITGGLIAIIGYFVRKELSTLNVRLDKHDTMLFNLLGQVSELIGVVYERRSYQRPTKVD